MSSPALRHSCPRCPCSSSNGPPRAVCADRRSEHRLHRAQYLRGIHHQHLQRELYCARARSRPADAAYLRFYHAMYQTMMFGMNLAFVSNNIGLLWVAVELATLTTVLMVGIYRTHAALEAAWKYFILGSVELPSLCSARSWSMAARRSWAKARTAWSGRCWSNAPRGFRRGPSQCCLRIPVSRLRHKVGLAPLHAWLPDAAEGPTPISAVLSGLLLNVALCCCASRYCSLPTGSIAPVR